MREIVLQLERERKCMFVCLHNIIFALCYLEESHSTGGASDIFHLMHGFNHSPYIVPYKGPLNFTECTVAPFCLHPVWLERRIPGAKSVRAERASLNEFPSGRQHVKYCHRNQWIFLEQKTALATDPKLVITSCQKHLMLMKEKVRQMGIIIKPTIWRCYVYPIWAPSPSEKRRRKLEISSAPFHKVGWLEKYYDSWILKEKASFLFLPMEYIYRNIKNNNWTQCKLSEQSVLV